MKRSDCDNIPRPCTRSECRYNFAADPEWGEHSNPEGCVLDLLDAQPYPHTLGEIGDIYGLTRERVRQIQVKALRKLHRACVEQGIDPDDFLRRLETFHMVDSTYGRRARAGTSKARNDRGGF